MPQILIHFDEATLAAIDRIAPAAKRKRAEFYPQGCEGRSLPARDGANEGGLSLAAGFGGGRGRLGLDRRLDGMRQFEIWWATCANRLDRVRYCCCPDAYSYLHKLIAAEITTSIRDIASEVLLGEAEGLPTACVANFDNLRMVPRESLTRLAGRHVFRRREDCRSLRVAK